ncbi:MAG TPA: hypothetical protein VN541_16940 [Tepidisphaeraceae bacterium]|nr:hypothetical protein [Tepidisphaeraceae bacterium]
MVPDGLLIPVASALAILSACTTSFGVIGIGYVIWHDFMHRAGSVAEVGGDIGVTVLLLAIGMCSGFFAARWIRKLK